jgi:hypothetical protein
MELGKLPASFDWADLYAPELRERVHPPLAVDMAKLLEHAPSITITGPTGVGKTSLAIAMSRGQQALYVSWRTRMRWLWSNRKAFEDLARVAPVLVLDDLNPNEYRRRHLIEYGDSDFLDRAREADLETLGDTLWSRHGCGRKTIVATTGTEHEIEYDYGVGVSNVVFSQGTSLVDLDADYKWTPAVA